MGSIQAEHAEHHLRPETAVPAPSSTWDRGPRRLHGGWVTGQRSPVGDARTGWAGPVLAQDRLRLLPTQARALSLCHPEEAAELSLSPGLLAAASSFLTRLQDRHPATLAGNAHPPAPWPRPSDTCSGLQSHQVWWTHGHTSGRSPPDLHQPTLPVRGRLTGYSPTR